MRLAPDTGTPPERRYPSQRPSSHQMQEPPRPQPQRIPSMQRASVSQTCQTSRKRVNWFNSHYSHPNQATVMLCVADASQRTSATLAPPTPDLVKPTTDAAMH